MIKAAVLGHPIAHSKSPLIHNHWIQKYRIQGSYEAIDVPPEDLENAIHFLRDEGYAGFNVTLPHKERMLELCDKVYELAQAVGAVNTVAFRGSQVWGTNTDVFGFTENIKAMRPDFDFARGPAVVLGAGGAARAVIFALARAGVPEIRLVNRTRSKAEVFSQVYSNVKVFNWDERAKILEGTNLLVNTTSMGMDKQEKLEIDLKALPKAALVNDIVYNPLMTNLLNNAREHGNITVTGIGMLLHQARPSFQSWFGFMPDIDPELIAKVLT